MQYHYNGFKSGDPSVAPRAETPLVRPDAVDVLIVGCGPAGLTLAAQLCAFPDISVRIIDRKGGPLEIGQADGISCRSMEMFEAFGFAEKVRKEGYWVNEVSFWRPEKTGKALVRANRIADTEDDLSEMPHIILSQARIHDFFLEVMGKSSHRLTPDYHRQLTSLTRTPEPDFPVVATLDCLDKAGETELVKARYVVGCDGARSRVRDALGQTLKGSSARQLWGVMDILPRTNFPDIRLKCAIQSKDAGSVLIIPREGGFMVRLYIELDELDEGERAGDRHVTPELLLAKAQAILAPYSMDAAEIAWWSAYEIGQRICDAFDDVEDVDRGTKEPRIFIAGDACHTHSPKAGQGMNVSMADTFNLGWKLAAVLRGHATHALLDTYSQERQSKALELIEFDKDMARLFSAKPSNSTQAALFQKYFQKHGRYTAGVETCYAPSLITTEPQHQELAKGFAVGKRFHSVPVIRLADAKPLQLAHSFKADGRWRLVVFAPDSDDGGPHGAVADLCARLSSPDGLVRRFTPPDANIDSVFDLRAVFQQAHRDMDLTQLPPLLLPVKRPLNLVDYEKVFCPVVQTADIFDLREIDRQKGAIVVVRPDQYVSGVSPIGRIHKVDAFFEQIFLPLRR